MKHSKQRAPKRKEPEPLKPVAVDEGPNNVSPPPAKKPNAWLAYSFASGIYGLAGALWAHWYHPEFNAGEDVRLLIARLRCLLADLTNQFGLDTVTQLADVLTRIENQYWHADELQRSRRAFAIEPLAYVSWKELEGLAQLAATRAPAIPWYQLGKSIGEFSLTMTIQTYCSPELTIPPFDQVLDALNQLPDSATQQLPTIQRLKQNSTRIALADVAAYLKDALGTTNPDPLAIAPDTFRTFKGILEFDRRLQDELRSLHEHDDVTPSDDSSRFLGLQWDEKSRRVWRGNSAPKVDLSNNKIYWGLFLALVDLRDEWLPNERLPGIWIQHGRARKPARATIDDTYCKLNALIKCLGVHIKTARGLGRKLAPWPQDRSATDNVAGNVTR